MKTVRRMAGWDAQRVRSVMTEVRERGESDIDYVSDTLNVVGGASDQVLRRRVACRACGEEMPKGAAAIQFAYRFHPDAHPYRISEAFMHRVCPSKASCGNCGSSVHLATRVDTETGRVSRICTSCD